MDCYWIKISPSISQGIAVINQLEESRFEHFIRRIVNKLKLSNTEIFTEDERQKLEKLFNIDQDHLNLAVKTIQYVFKKILKYIFMPNNLKDDLRLIGLNNGKADSIVKVWSAETRTTLNELGSFTDKNNDELSLSWKLNAELSSHYHKKCKMPKTYLSLSRPMDKAEIELTHPELYSFYIQLESIQNELDNVV